MFASAPQFLPLVHLIQPGRHHGMYLFCASRTVTHCSNDVHGNVALARVLSERDQRYPYKEHWWNAEVGAFRRATVNV